MRDLRLDWMMRHIENGTYQVKGPDGISPEEEMGKWLEYHRPYAEAAERFMTPFFVCLSLLVLGASVHVLGMLG